MTAAGADLLTVRQVAALLAVTEDAVGELIADGRLAADGGLVDPVSLRSWVLTRPPDRAADHPTPGQLAALHAKAGELDRRDREPKGTWKRAILDRASAQHGRRIESARELSSEEAAWVLDALAAEVER